MKTPLLEEKKQPIEWCRLCCKEKAGFLIRQTLYISMTKCAIRFIYAADFFMLRIKIYHSKYVVKTP